MCDELWYLWPTYAQTTGLAIKEEKPLLLLLPEAETVTSRVRFSFLPVGLGKKHTSLLLLLLLLAAQAKKEMSGQQDFSWSQFT